MNFYDKKKIYYSFKFHNFLIKEMEKTIIMEWYDNAKFIFLEKVKRRVNVWYMKEKSCEDKIYLSNKN